MKKLFIFLTLLNFLVSLPAQQRKDLSTLEKSEKVSFVKTENGSWGIEIQRGESPCICQPTPAMIEVCKAEDDICRFSAGYESVTKSATGMTARANIRYTEAVIFHVNDSWSITGSVLTVKRTVEVEGNSPEGFNSSVVLTLDPSVGWSDVNCLAPGALYGDPSFDGELSPGGTANYASHQFLMREDMLSAPLFALSFGNGTYVAMLDPSPRGETTLEETRLDNDAMTDARYLFGSMGAWQKDNDPVSFGFIFPGTANVYPRVNKTNQQPRWIRRYHPVTEGVVHNYKVSFRFGNSATFSNVTRESWRWAWNTLNPEVYPIDVEQMRRILTDHLAAQAVTIEGRTAIPFVISPMDTAKHRQWNWTMSAMGFVGKTIECADQLLRESDRDTTERGQKMRQTGLSIISSLISALPTVPLQGTGYDFATGKPWDHVWVAPWLRNATEDMRVLIRAYRRERTLGHEHPEWFSWVNTYVDWLMLQQREDGSFPRRWVAGSDEVAEPTGTTSYCPVPLLVMMSEETGDPKYKQAAVKAAEYVWENWGKRGLFIGGASDNPNITDKEAGMLSMEAFLSLFESTGDKKWLERAKTAADFTESWIWIWNVPMPLDAEDSSLHWKKGVPTIGLQGISALHPGGVDEYLDWSASSFARLYKYTNDTHYLDVARILLHDTKAMVAIPGRLYDLKGIGWQQEHWRMGPGGPGRGVGGHRFWLPWVSANHLYSITGLEEVDKELFMKLSNPVD
jgi:hypothetical protein